MYHLFIFILNNIGNKIIFAIDKFDNENNGKKI